MIRKRSITIRGHRTSISLEEPFWEGLRTIAKHESRTIGSLITAIDRKRQPDGNLSSAVRIYVLNWYRDRSTD